MRKRLSLSSPGFYFCSSPSLLSIALACFVSSRSFWHFLVSGFPGVLSPSLSFPRFPLPSLAFSFFTLWWNILASIALPVHLLRQVFSLGSCWHFDRIYFAFFFHIDFFQSIFLRFGKGFGGQNECQNRSFLGCFFRTLIFTGFFAIFKCFFYGSKP